MIDLKNAFLIVAALAVVTIVGFYIPFTQYTSNQDSHTISGTSNEAVAYVVYTNAGFEPSTLSVASGTTVLWTNDSDKLLWVASNPHPSHTNLPGFDEGGIEGTPDVVGGVIPVAYAHSRASIYRYTFLEAGSWAYHNHLVPTDRGIVVVE